MKLFNTYNKLELCFKDSLIEKIGETAIKKYPDEFGGFLVGRYSEDFKSVEVTDYILPKKYRNSPALFQRSTYDIEKIFKELFIAKKEYYIGEWHSHPNGSTIFSQTDLKAMKESVDCPTVIIKNPILLIVSINRLSLKGFTFYLYEKNKLFAYE